MTSPQLGEVINTLEHSTKPIVAAVDGLALGGQEETNVSFMTGL